MLSSFFSPLRFGILFALLVVLIWRWLPRWMRALALVPLLACVLMTLPWVANAMIGWQEGRSAVSERCLQSPPHAVVVLSGGTTRQPTDETDFSALGESSLRRLIGAVDRLRQQPDARLVISGGSTVYGVGEGALMRAFAERLGVAGENTMLENASHSTWQNAQFVRALEPALPSRIWLVTSAAHMPRSRYAFERPGSRCAPGRWMRATHEPTASDTTFHQATRWKNPTPCCMNGLARRRIAWVGFAA